MAVSALIADNYKAAMVEGVADKGKPAAVDTVVRGKSAAEGIEARGTMVAGIEAAVEGTRAGSGLVAARDLVRGSLVRRKEGLVVAA